MKMSQSEGCMIFCDVSHGSTHHDLSNGDISDILHYYQDVIFDTYHVSSEHYITLHYHYFIRHLHLK